VTTSSWRTASDVDTARVAGPNGRAAAAGGVPPGPVAPRRRLSGPRLLLGVLLLLGGALVGTAVAAQVDTRVPVLAAARPVAAGQTITDADLKTVRVAAESDAGTMPASERGSVVGRAAALPLAEGSLLSQRQVGALAWPAKGESVMAVAVKPGRAPSGLAAGAKVTVLVVPTSGGPAGSAGAAPSNSAQVVQARATVVSVEAAADQSGVTVVSLLLGETAAVRVASATGDVSLVQLGVGG